MFFVEGIYYVILYTCENIGEDGILQFTPNLFKIKWQEPQQLLISISNHSEPQVLSVIAQQILQIQNAIKAESVEKMLVECRVDNWEGPGSIDDSFCLFGDVLFGDL